MVQLPLEIIQRTQSVASVQLEFLRFSTSVDLNAARTQLVAGRPCDGHDGKHKWTQHVLSILVGMWFPDPGQKTHVVALCYNLLVDHHPSSQIEKTRRVDGQRNTDETT